MLYTGYNTSYSLPVFPAITQYSLFTPALVDLNGNNVALDSKVIYLSDVFFPLYLNPEAQI